MKAFEFEISYDPTLLKVINVREGNIFDRYETFFNNGTINNKNGEITMIYGLVLGEGNVTSPGTLVWVDFESKQTIGQSPITLSNVGVTNENTYLPISFSHGTVEIQGMLPLIKNISIDFSNALDTDPLFGWYRVECLIDDDNLDKVFLDITLPDGSVVNTSMSQLSDELFMGNVSCKGHGIYSYHLYVVDTSGNSVSSNVFSFVIPPNWDVNCDGVASVLDFTHISNKIGVFGNPGWIREDVNNNGIVSLSDLVMVATYYNQVW
jgi:hypothetical protein